MDFLEARCRDLNADRSLQIMYGLDGRRVLTEESLDHLDGYRGSRPLRIGNRAYAQVQLDIYGELMDSVYLTTKCGAPISYDLWTDLRTLVTWVCDNWRRHDEGIWEVRGERRHFVYSKLMCWVAFDRGLRLADKRSSPADRDQGIPARGSAAPDPGTADPRTDARLRQSPGSLHGADRQERRCAGELPAGSYVWNSSAPRSTETARLTPASRGPRNLPRTPTSRAD